MKVKMILPSLNEAGSPSWRPIKYSLFPPIGLATLAGYFSPYDEVVLCDGHVEEISFDDKPDLVCIQTYVTNAERAYKIADLYRSKGSYVALGGLHATNLPQEALQHADSVILGPGEEAFPCFIRDFRNKCPQRIYKADVRTLENLPSVRRDLIKRKKYLAPNSLVVSRGCPHSCDFCYKHAFYGSGKSFYTQRVDIALAEIESLPGKHLYFLDDHLLGSPKFASELFEGMKGMNRLFQCAATVDSILESGLIEKAAQAGLRSVFVGFETFSAENLRQSNKYQNISKDYGAAVKRLRSLGIMINGSFVFGLDNDGADVFKRTVDWGIEHALATATYHILTPYPGTRLFDLMEKQGRILTYDWSKYDTRTAVYRPAKLTVSELEEGYWNAYKEFYAWKNIFRSCRHDETTAQRLSHFAYTAGWKKAEPFWKLIVKTGLLNKMLPVLEFLLGHTI